MTRDIYNREKSIGLKSDKKSTINNVKNLKSKDFKFGERKLSLLTVSKISIHT